MLVVVGLLSSKVMDTVLVVSDGLVAYVHFSYVATLLVYLPVKMA